MKRILLSLSLLSLWGSMIAAVEPAKIFGSHMVLQQGMENPVWGWAEKGEKITITFNGKTYKTNADKSGKWKVMLPSMEYGGPYNMSIKGKNTVEFSNIMIGEVWVCSGQSNMEWPVNMVNNAEQEVSEANYPKIRLFKSNLVTSQFPRKDFTDEQWVVCSPATIPNFSAVGYFFGRDIHKELDVAVGLIQSAWGGTIAETWISPETIAKDPDFASSLKTLQDLDLDNYIAEIKKKITEKLGKYPTKDNGEELGYYKPETDVSGWIDMKVPTIWEAQGYDLLDGVAWYQTTFELTANQARGDMMMSLATVDDLGAFWLNGKKFGQTDRYRTDVTFSVKSEFLKPGKNVLIARIRDTGGGGGFNGSPEDFYISNTESKVSLAGTWKAIFTEVVESDTKLGPNSYPTLLYNGMINPIVPYGIKGAIWYQGESNADRAKQYQRIFPALIKDWRAKWGYDFPFIWVQLANYMRPDAQPAESGWAELREAQTMTLSLPNTAQALAIDIGEANDIHPRNKQDVGKRLALGAKAVAYDLDVVYSGPTYESMKVEGNKAIITYSNIGAGLDLKDKYGYLNGYAVAGKDGKFYWAKGYIKDNKAIVWCDKVETPVHVRYAWGNNPEDVNLYNKEGLPAVPFRTGK